jgi:hypothetical protein
LTGASGASGGLFYFILTLNSYQAKNYVRLNLYSEYTSKLSINASEAHHKSSWSSQMMAEHPLGVFGFSHSYGFRFAQFLLKLDGF